MSDTDTSTQPSHSGSSQPPLWMITFGDLLTLLLCFFLTIIGLGPLGKGKITQSNKDVTAQKAEAPTAREERMMARASGTILANITNESAPGVRSSSSQRSLRLVISRTDFSADEVSLGESAVLRIASAGEEIRNSMRVRIETCGEPGSAELDRQVVERAKSLAAAVRGTGIDAALIDYAPMIDGCDQLKLPEDGSAELRAVIRLQDRAQKNG